MFCKMATISSEKLRQDVKAIIKTADLSTLSAKKIRLQLQEEYETDLSSRKKELEGIIYEAFKARQNNDNDSGESEASENESSQEAKNGDSQSNSESDFEEPEDHDSPKKKKAKKPSSKPKAGSLDDEELAKQLQEQEDFTGRRTRNQSKPVRRKPKAKSGGGGGEGGTVKKRTGYSQPCALSDKLAALMGTNEMARSDVIKKMWEIVRERNLVDPKNKQFMICDEELYKVFGRRRVRTFGMMKYLSDHIFKK